MADQKIIKHRVRGYGEAGYYSRCGKTLDRYNIAVMNGSGANCETCNRMAEEQRALSKQRYAKVLENLENHSAPLRRKLPRRHAP